jgi:hypothetical protein
MREDSLKWHEDNFFLAIDLGGESKRKEKKKVELKGRYENNWGNLGNKMERIHYRSHIV